MKSAEVAERLLAKQEPPRDELDGRYLAACKAAGINPELARRRELPQVLRIPPGASRQLHRGKRNGVALVDQCGEHERDEEVEREEREAGVVLDQHLALFIAEAGSALEAGHRFAALLMRTRDFGPSEMMRKWKDLTEAKLRTARSELEALLEQADEGAAP